MPNWDGTADDLIDTRDLIEYREYWSDESDAEWNDICKEIDELEAQGISDWEYGATLISDSYFKQYAEELASDIGAISPDAQWPLNHINWEAAATALQMDYTRVEFLGMTYWVRS